MKLFHITCLNRAMNVYKTETWQYSDAGDDRGMNLFDMRADFTKGNDIEHTGARLVFQWLGGNPVKVDMQSLNSNRKDTLVDQHPWRMFVGSTLSSHLMQIHSIELLDNTAHCDQCKAYGPVGFLDKFIPSTRTAAIHNLVNRTNESLLKKKRFIKQMTKNIDFVAER
jgi:hypothetical protein